MSGLAILETSVMGLPYTLFEPENDLIRLRSVEKTVVLIAFTFLEAAVGQLSMLI